MISVVIPALNEAGFIGDCLKSVRMQSVPCEIIVVDGGSVDGTVEIAKKYADKVYVIEEKGIGVARDYGARMASGEIIVSADADAIYPKNWLENLTKHFGDPSVVAVGGSFVPRSDTPMARRFAGALTYFAENFHLFAGSNMAFRKTAFLEVGGYKRVAKGEDWDLSARLAKMGKTVYEPNAVAFIDVPLNRELEMLMFNVSVGGLITMQPPLVGLGSGFLLTELVSAFFHEPGPIHHSQIGLAGMLASLLSKSVIPEPLREGLAGFFTGVTAHHLVTEDVLDPRSLSTTGSLMSGLLILLLSY